MKGRKRHIVVDTMGNLLAVIVHAANIHDTKVVISVAEQASQRHPFIERFCADAGYQGTFVLNVDEIPGPGVDITKKIKPHEWEKLPWRWIVEPTFAWLNNSRRLSREWGPLQGSPSRGRSSGRQIGDESHKRGLNTKLHLAVDSHGMPLRAVIAQGTTADCTQAIGLIDGLDAQHFLAGRGYDSDAIIDQAKLQGMESIIPPKKNRKVQREYDKDLYKARRLVGNAFLYLKQWRGIEICKKYSLLSGLYSNQALIFMGYCLVTAPPSIAIEAY